MVFYLKQTVVTAAGSKIQQHAVLSPGDITGLRPDNGVITVRAATWPNPIEIKLEKRHDKLRRVPAKISPLGEYYYEPTRHGCHAIAVTGEHAILSTRFVANRVVHRH